MNAITQIFDTIQSSVVSPLYYGLLTVAAGIALVCLIVAIFTGVLNPGEENSRKPWIKRCAIIIICVVLLAFAPAIINWAIGLGNGNIPSFNG